MNAVVVPAVRDGGRIATLRGYDGGDVERRGITFCPIFVRNYARKHDKLDDLRDLAEQGESDAPGGADPSGRRGTRSPSTARGRGSAGSTRPRVLTYQPRRSISH